MTYSNDKKRCTWCLHQNPAIQEALIAYHDKEWGRPHHHDQSLFELLILEGVQAGLNWATVLAKRDAYRIAYDQFDPQVVAAYGPRKEAELLSNPGLIRNRLKIKASIKNAQIYLQIQEEHGSFNNYIWGFVDGRTVQNRWHQMEQVPVTTPIAQRMSQALKKEGFSFIGPTICYAFMQAAGLVNDHIVDCFVYQELQAQIS